MTEAPTASPYIQPIPELFTSSVSVLWATTYNVDLTLFNEFLLGRLGDPPLNVVVLADQRRLTASLERVTSQQIDTLTAINSRWLLRGVRPGGQAFHPKSYLAISGARAILLIGSGNLSYRGINEGHEVFTTFYSGTPVGDSVIADWLGWMRRLVEMVGDTTLADRFRHLNEHFSTPSPVSTSNTFLHNLDEPIADQLIYAVKAKITGEVDELLLTAPFYDDAGYAVARLLADLKPRRVRIFLTQTTSVNGVLLMKLLTESKAHIDVQFYEPDSFVHAKLIGIVAGHHRWLLSGSANLSQAALMRSASEGGNVELCILSNPEPDKMTGIFVPPEMTTSTHNLDSLQALSLRQNEEDISAPTSVHLITATTLSDNRIEIHTNPSFQPGWLLDDLAERQPLSLENSGRTITVGQLSGRLVQLIDGGGNKISNRVVVDDPISLAAIMTSVEGHSTNDRPTELIAGDLDTPLGQALTWLNRNLIMDVTERLTKVAVGGVTAGESGKQADDDLWQRLEREQLIRDPRINTYRRIWVRNSSIDSEPILELIDTLYARMPTGGSGGRVGHSLLSHLLDHNSLSGDQLKRPSHPWKPSAKIRVRARNVLRRWADAQTDERLAWVDPLAPAGNFAMITGALAYLQIERARDLQNRLNDSFTVFHSFHIAGKNKAGHFTEGEIDYLVFSPRYGFLVLEVKGGGIKYDGQTGTWYQNDRPLKMSPFEQGSQVKHKLRTWLSRRGVNLPDGYYEDAVCFPDVFRLVQPLPKGIDPVKCILGSDIGELEKRVTEIMTSSGIIGQTDIDRQTQTTIRYQLMPLCEYGTSLVDRIGQAERQIYNLTENQCIVLDFLSEHRQALIEGCSGSGKTIMAIKKARELGKAGKSVLLLAYNQLIGEHLAASVAGLNNVHADNYHQFCLDLLDKSGTLTEDRSDAFYRKQVPDLFAQYLSNHPTKFDTVIIDEGQDFSTEYWLNILEMIGPDGYFYIFYDPAQNIFEKSIEFPIKEKPFTLKENCRNTAKIVEAMKPYASCEMRVKKDSPAGEEVTFFRSADPKSRRGELARILHDLINVQGLRPQDIVILGGHSLTNTWLTKHPQIGNYTVTEGPTDVANSIKYYTYMKYKGCESTAVIIFDVDPDDPRWADNNALYTAMGRAKQLLYVISVK